jgi:trehalose-phosphatase
MDALSPYSSPADILSAIVSGPGRRRLLLFDFDGTLVEFAPVPGAVSLPESRREWLERIATRPDAVLGFVSGRRLDDLRSRVDVAGAWYAGLHGLELHLAGEPLVRHPALEEFTPLALALANRFASRVDWPGVWIEYKGASVAVHWREAATEDGMAARAALATTADEPEFRGRLRLLDGDHICEALPDVPWDKGRAVEAMQERVAQDDAVAPWTVFVGDDWTDEHAFEALGTQGVSVCVGQRPSKAHFRLATPSVVEEFLAQLATAPSLARPAASPK